MTLARGRHHCGWYYGSGHLVVKSMPFILEGLRENARFYLCVEPEIQARLLHALGQNGAADLRPGTISELDLQPLRWVQQTKGVRGLRKLFLHGIERVRAEGFSQVRFLCQVVNQSRASHLPLDEMLKLERACHEAARGLPLLSLTMFDAGLSTPGQELRNGHLVSITKRLTSLGEKGSGRGGRSST